MTETMTVDQYRTELAKPAKVSQSEKIARQFAAHVRARNLPEPRSRFHPSGEVRFMLGEVIHRQSKRLKNRDSSPAWRFDFAWEPQRIAVEIEGVCVRKGADGNTVMGGRHANIQGFKDDCEKYAWAAVMGWRVLRFEQSQVAKGYAVDMLVRLFAACTVPNIEIVPDRPRGPAEVHYPSSHVRRTDELNFGGVLDRDPF